MTDRQYAIYCGICLKRLGLVYDPEVAQQDHYCNDHQASLPVAEPKDPAPPKGGSRKKVKGAPENKGASPEG